MTYTYLALGDSYTIGEQVPIHESFPYQTIQMLRKKWDGLHTFHAPEVIAKTGWTTDELDAQILETTFIPSYDFVSLLIGVNNQYRGRSIENYRHEFETLLKKALRFSGGNTSRVFVISIPDWGITPFAAERDSTTIAKEIDEYNQACKEITLNNQIEFIDITESQRKDGKDSSYIASDGLHPSGLEYKKWATALSAAISSRI